MQVKEAVCLISLGFQAVNAMGVAEKFPLTEEFVLQKVKTILVYKDAPPSEDSNYTEIDKEKTLQARIDFIDQYFNEQLQYFFPHLCEELKNLEKQLFIQDISEQIVRTSADARAHLKKDKK